MLNVGLEYSLDSWTTRYSVYVSFVMVTIALEIIGTRHGASLMSLKHHQWNDLEIMTKCYG